MGPCKETTDLAPGRKPDNRSPSRAVHASASIHGLGRRCWKKGVPPSPENISRMREKEKERKQQKMRKERDETIKTEEIGVSRSFKAPDQH